MSLGYQPTLDWARAQDAADALGPLRSEFEFPPADSAGPLVYLCGNSLGLMPRRVRPLLQQELDDWARFAVEGHHEAATPWYSYHENFRESGARLVGARPGEVVMMNALTVNLHLLMVSFYRPSGRRRKVLIEEAAFPSDTYAVASHLAARGIDPDDSVVVARPEPGSHCLDTAALEARIAGLGDELALVLLPGVQYYTGQRLDVARITNAAHAVGAMAGFDLAHAAGNVPLELHDWNVDFAAWCSYKYLNAGPGAVGGCFVHARHGDAGLPRFAGWWGNDPDTRFRLHLNERFVPRPGADGWQISNPPVFAMTPLLASIGQFDRIGMAALRAKSERLTGYLEYLIDRIPAGRVEQITPRDPAARGCQLSLLVRGQGREAFDRVRARGILPDFRQPDVIRMAPVPLYNSFEDVWRAGTALAEALDA
ncbi:MAG: kynureninase [Gemmatimonadales bacterium]